uniref:Uncharacterized protein n=1 Tax=Daucus carota subsp. sativus TaxID=79200 RepID=A0A161ZWZ2_DAUCS
MSNDDNSPKSCHIFTSEDNLQDHQNAEVLPLPRTPLSNITNSHPNKSSRFRFLQAKAAKTNFQNEGPRVMHLAHDDIDNQLPREVPVSRSPLSDITIASQNKSSRFRSLNTGSSETNIQSTTRNLYRDSFENEEQSKKYFNHDDIECSTVQDPVFSDESDSDYVCG